MMKNHISSGYPQSFWKLKAKFAVTVVAFAVLLQACHENCHGNPELFGNDNVNFHYAWTEIGSVANQRVGFGMHYQRVQLLLQGTHRT